MKRLFKFCIPKILFLLLITNTGIRPAAVIPLAAIGVGELVAVTAVGTFAIYEILDRYRSNAGELNEEVVDEVI